MNIGKSQIDKNPNLNNNIIEITDTLLNKIVI
jgi:hypothetical protein